MGYITQKQVLRVLSISRKKLNDFRAVTFEILSGSRRSWVSRKMQFVGYV